MLIRRPRPDELSAITAMVRSVVAESFPEGSPSELDRIGAEDWSPSWVAISSFRGMPEGHCTWLQLCTVRPQPH